MNSPIKDLKFFAQALGGEISGGQILAPGPGHSTRDRSLSVKLDDKAPDGFVVNSFAGNDPIICRDYIRQKIGMPAFKPNGKRLIAKFDYKNEQGNLLYQVLKYEPKSFSQRRPDGKGGWINNVDGVRRVLYRLPEILKYPDATIFFCEGEKDADRVASFKYCATTIASGTWTNECAQALAGRDVLILEDNDDSGRKRALAAAQELRGKAKTLRIVRLPGLQDKQDVSNWLDVGNTAEDLVRVSMETPLWSPTSDTKEADTALESVRASDVKITAIRWLWPKRFALGKLGLIAGLPDVGKGQVLCDMAARVTHGFEWPCNEGHAPQGNVVLLSAEDDPSDTVVPRLIAAGADLERIEIVRMVRAPLMALNACSVSSLTCRCCARKL
jgi:AAA domain